MLGPDCEVVLHDLAADAALHRRDRERPRHRPARGRRPDRPDAALVAQRRRHARRAPLRHLDRRQDPQVARGDPARRRRSADRRARRQPRRLRASCARSARSPRLATVSRPGDAARARDRGTLRRRHPRRAGRHDQRHPDRHGQDAGHHDARREDGGRRPARRARRLPCQALRRAGRRGARPLALHGLQLPQGDPPPERRPSAAGPTRGAGHGAGRLARHPRHDRRRHRRSAAPHALRRRPRCSTSCAAAAPRRSP